MSHLTLGPKFVLSYVTNISASIVGPMLRKYCCSYEIGFATSF